MAFTAISAAIGLGTAAVGYVNQSKQVKKANKATKAANAAQMDVQAASEDAAAASQAAERLREQQMELEGIRRRRDIIRAAQGAAAVSRARSVAQGAQDSSSARAGVQRNATQGRIDALANLQNIEIGRGVFEQNRLITDANTRGAQAQTVANISMSQANTAQNYASYYGNLATTGLNIAQNAVTIGNVAETSIFGSRTSAQPAPATQWRPLT